MRIKGYAVAACMLMVGCKSEPAPTADKDKEIARLQAALEAAKKAPAAPAPAAAPVAPVAPAAPAVQSQRGTLAIASFKSGSLDACLTATVTTTLPYKPRIAPEQIGVILVEEFLVSEARLAGSLLGTKKDPRKLTGGVGYMLIDLDADTIPGATPDMIAKFKKEREEAMTDPAKKAKWEKDKAKLSLQLEKAAKELSWPPKSFAEKAKRGDLSKVEECSFPNRMALATCTVGDSVPELAWTLEQKYFNVATAVDSDAAFKHCLSIAGKWSAPNHDDPAVAEERMRQHARKLQEVADPDRLRDQIKQLQNAARGD